MKRILLTGGSGFFCSRFNERYKDEYQILSLNKSDLNVTNEESVMNIIKEFRPDYVIHAAAIAVTDFCNQNPEIAYKINVEGSINIAKACKEVGAKLLFISTEQVFNGNTECGPYDEEHTPVPDTVYGKNKLEAEKLIKEILDEVWIVRFTWQFGTTERSLGMADNILWSTIKSLLKGEKIYASPNEYRGMGYINEMIEEIVKIFDLPYSTYHIGSENDLSRYDVVKHILIEMGLEDKINEILIEDDKYKQKARDIRLNIDKAKEHGLVFSNTKDALSKCIKEYKLNIR